MEKERKIEKARSIFGQLHFLNEEDSELETAMAMVNLYIKRLQDNK